MLDYLNSKLRYFRNNGYQILSKLQHNKENSLASKFAKYCLILFLLYSSKFVPDFAIEPIKNLDSVFNWILRLSLACSFYKLCVSLWYGKSKFDQFVSLVLKFSIYSLVFWVSLSFTALKNTYDIPVFIQFKLALFIIAIVLVLFDIGFDLFDNGFDFI